MGINNTPPVGWTKIIQSKMFTKYLHKGIAFCLGFFKAMQYPFKIFLICYGAQRIYNIL
jgi:hypothetical protein